MIGWLNPFRRERPPQRPMVRVYGEPPPEPVGALGCAPTLPAPKEGSNRPGSAPAPHRVNVDSIDAVRPALRPERWIEDGLAEMSIEVHAERLFRWICEDLSLPRELLSWEVQARYADMCCELMWRPQSWNMVGGRLGVLAARPRAGSRKTNRKPYAWKVIDGRRHKLRVYWFDPERVRKLRRRDEAGNALPSVRSCEELAQQMRRAA